MAEVRQPLFGKVVETKKRRGRKSIDLVDEKFGRLTVVKRMAIQQKGHTYWLCRCVCGNEVSVSTTNLRAGNKGVRSCGCLMRDYLAGMQLAKKPMQRKHLSDEQVSEIRWLYESGCMSQRELADQFGVSALTVFNLVNNITRVFGRARQLKRKKLNIAES